MDCTLPLRAVWEPVLARSLASHCASAAGYHVLSVTSADTLPNSTCALSSTFSYGRAPLFAQCTLTPSGTTLLSVYVDKTCAGAVRWLQACVAVRVSQLVGLPLILHHSRPSLACLRHSTCLKPSTTAHPASPAAVEISPLQDEACAEPGQSFWSSIRIRGRYVTPAKIATMLNTVTTNLTRWACAGERCEQDAMPCRPLWPN